MSKKLAEISEENGIVYYLAENECYYPDLGLPEGTHYNVGKYGIMRWDICRQTVEGNIFGYCWMGN